MDIQSVVAELRQEVMRIEQAIAALMGLGSQPIRRGRPPKSSRAKPASAPKPRRMSAAARARIGAAKKAWWAKQQGKSGLLAKRFVGIEAQEATMTSVDRLGFHVRPKTQDGVRGARTALLREVRSQAQTREGFVEMVQQARQGIS